jgi:two-component system, LuxR family, response regulator FixJ
MIMNNKPVTVYVIDDEQDVRDALRMLLKSIGLEVETFGSATEFIEQYQVDWPGCIVVDIRMPGMSGIELQEKLNTMGAPIPVIIISGHADVPTAVQVIQEGAVDLLEKPFSDQRLLDKVQAAIKKDRELRDAFLEHKQIQGCYDTLTPREKQIMSEVAAGKMNKVIAYELNITTRTVELHRAHVMEKMQARSLADLFHFEQAMNSVT